MQRQLTAAFLRSVKPPASGRLEISDTRCAGLAFRVTPRGIRSWAFRCRIDGKERRLLIGPYPAFELAAAREVAEALRRTVAEGGNPIEQKRVRRANTFGALAQRYLKEHSERKKRTHKADSRNLRLHVLPHWADRPLSSIRRADAIDLIEGLVTAGKPILANRVQSLISHMFTFALDAALVESHPCYRLAKRGVENVGRRVLSDSEIRLFWNGIVEAPIARRLGLALRLALLTGTRISEVMGLCRKELHEITDPARSAWIIPGTRTKNGRDHLVPLTELARETILELLAMIEPGEQYLFPTPQRPGPLPGKTLTKRMETFGQRLIGDDDAARTWRADMPSPHDLRRTVETRMAALRIPLEIRDRVLNHVTRGVGSKHYNLHDYVDEKREALARWSLALTAILHGTGATVVPLARGIGGVR